MMASEATIAVARQQTTDAAGRLGSLFDAHHQRLYRLARRMAGDGETARDLVQETFLRAARSPGRIPPDPAAEEAWLVRVLVNLCRDRWRRQTTRSRFELEEAVAQPRATTDPESALIARAVVWHALANLPPRRRAVLVMHELEGATIEQVATLLDISATTVRWHLSRGRRELVRAISRQGARK
jgi:RNA polymerase sigma-70 factor (ECF subfamily)